MYRIAVCEDDPRTAEQNKTAACHVLEGKGRSQGRDYDVEVFHTAAPLMKRLMVLLEQPISLASSGWLMLCSFIKSARRTLDGAGRYSCATWSALLLAFFLIIIRFAVLFNIRFPLCPCCCNSATSKGFFLFPLQFCRFFAFPPKFSVYSGTRQKTPEFPLWGTLVQHITPPRPVAAGCGVL